jgi:hypothetical protein
VSSTTILFRVTKDDGFPIEFTTYRSSEIPLVGEYIHIGPNSTLYELVLPNSVALNTPTLKLGDRDTLTLVVTMREWLLGENGSGCRLYVTPVNFGGINILSKWISGGGVSSAITYFQHIHDHV